MFVRTSLRAARTSRSGLPSFVLAGVLWGTGGIAGALLTSRAGLHPVAVATYRMSIGGLLITLYAVCTGRLRRLPVRRAQMARVATAGVLLAVFQAAYFAAVASTSVSLATLTTMVAVPVLVTVGSAVLERRRPSRAAVSGVAIAGLGLVLLLGAPTGAGGDRGAGTAFALVAAAGFAALTLDTRPDLPGFDRVAVTGLGFLAGGCLLLPIGLALGMGLTARADTLGAVVFLGVVPTAIAYFAFFAALGRSRPGGVIVAVLLEPLTATVLAVVCQGERLGAMRIAGGVLVLASIAVQQWSTTAGTPPLPRG
jgi:drug/metabolite transporter, DME family